MSRPRRTPRRSCGFDGRRGRTIAVRAGEGQPAEEEPRKVEALQAIVSPAVEVVGEYDESRMLIKLP